MPERILNTSKIHETLSQQLEKLKPKVPTWYQTQNDNQRNIPDRPTNAKAEVQNAAAKEVNTYEKTFLAGTAKMNSKPPINLNRATVDPEKEVRS